MRVFSLGLLLILILQQDESIIGVGIIFWTSLSMLTVGPGQLRASHTAVSKCLSLAVHLIYISS